MERDVIAELDEIKQQLAELQRLVLQKQEAASPASTRMQSSLTVTEDMNKSAGLGTLYYSGQVQIQDTTLRCEPQEKQVTELLTLHSDKAAKALSALAHKQRLDIIRAVLVEPLTGAELVEKLQMGTTGQLYHHVKALLGADLLHQEDGGRYAVPRKRAFSLLLLLASVSDILDTGNYVDMVQARSEAAQYLGSDQAKYDPHLALWAVMENCVLEHRAGFCTQVDLILHSDGSVTVSDNGRGIPVHTLGAKGSTNVEAVLTDISSHASQAPYRVPGAERGISIAVVNAFSSKLAVEIRREGKVYRQDYKHGIPASDLLVVGMTSESGTSVTFTPDPELFIPGFDVDVIRNHIHAAYTAYPGLAIQLHPNAAQL
ncbi:ATP-binding protein [Paenibacillus turpanensis]|uniref:ATP-binding protein n=1 Tax=Paenibacillus turpanensis TaxID=2689078 RepID=UPI0014074291|nr:ATP-binding protein [Paenibacillus turpanensis]